MGEAKRRGTFEERKANSKTSVTDFVKMGFDDEFGMVQIITNEKKIMKHIDTMPERKEVLFGIQERKRLNSELPFFIRIGNGLIAYTIKSGFYMVIFVGGSDSELLEKAERFKQKMLQHCGLKE
jgi:hypothetical protein